MIVYNQHPCHRLRYECLTSLLLKFYSNLSSVIASTSAGLVQVPPESAGHFHCWLEQFRSL